MITITRTEKGHTWHGAPISHLILLVSWIKVGKEKKMVSCHPSPSHIQMPCICKCPHCDMMVSIKLGPVFTKVRKLGSLKNKASFIGWIIFFQRRSSAGQGFIWKASTYFKQPKVQIYNELTSTEHLNLFKFSHSHTAIMTVCKENEHR